jgi:hypothetical protein
LFFTISVISFLPRGDHFPQLFGYGKVVVENSIVISAVRRYEDYKSSCRARSIWRCDLSSIFSWHILAVRAIAGDGFILFHLERKTVFPTHQPGVKTGEPLPQFKRSGHVFSFACDGLPTGVYGNHRQKSSKKSNTHRVSPFHY